MEEKEVKHPQYRLLYEVLRKQISNGIYKAGDILPSENDLHQVHNVTQPTIRQALAMLVNDGYIKKHQGKGSIVQELPKGLGILSIEGRLSNSGNNVEKLNTKIIDGPRLVDWPTGMMFTPIIAELEQKYFYIERQRTVAEVVVFYEFMYVPDLNIPKFSTRPLENKSFYDMLQKFYQIEIKGGEQKLFAINANAKIAAFLGIKKGQPVLRLVRRIDTNREGFSIYTSLFVNTHKYLLHGLI